MLDKLLKELEERQEQLKESLASGGIQNFESYQKNRRRNNRSVVCDT